MTTELTLLAWALVLALVQIIAAAQFATAAYGLAYNAGNRDTPPPRSLSLVGGRMKRASENMLETLPIAAGAILIAHAAGRHNGYTVWGAELYFWARLVYVPIYAAGIPFVRTLVFLTSVAGILLVLLGLATG